MADHQITSLSYGGQDIAISEGLLTVIEENDSWSLRVIANGGPSAHSMSAVAEVRLTIADGRRVTVHRRCTLVTENSRYHFEGEGLVGIVPARNDS